jgi:transcriptional regulator with XRE-family HTH domain
MDISHRLKLARLEKGLTQHEVAELAGVSQPMVSLTESGQRLGLTTLAIADVLDVPLNVKDVVSK